MEYKYAKLRDTACGVAASVVDQPPTSIRFDALIVNYWMGRMARENIKSIDGPSKLYSELPLW